MKKIFKKIGQKISYIIACLDLFFFDLRENYDILDYIIWGIGGIMIIAFIAWLVLIIF